MSRDAQIFVVFAVAVAACAILLGVEAHERKWGNVRMWIVAIAIGAVLNLLWQAAL